MKNPSMCANLVECFSVFVFLENRLSQRITLINILLLLYIILKSFFIKLAR